MSLDEQRIQRYARQIVLPEVGGRGQEKLLSARVLLIGAGGLGCPMALYLAGAGIGHLGIVDDDLIDLGNLHRQIAFDQTAIGRHKTDVLAERLAALNPDCNVSCFTDRLTDANAAALIGQFDIVADGSDNLATRRLVHDWAMRLGRPLVSAAVQGMDGQLTVYQAFAGSPHPCMYCRGPSEADEGFLPSCAGGGVLGPVAGIMGCLQANEVVKLALGMEPQLSGEMLIVDARSPDWLSVAMTRRADCQFCAGLPNQ